MKHQTTADIPRPAHISVEQIRPTVELATYLPRAPTDECWYQYELICPQWLLLESGRAECRAPARFTASAGSLICLPPAPRVVLGVVAGTRFYQLMLRFAPPPDSRLTPRLDGIGPLPFHLHLGDAFDRARRLFETICIELPAVPVAEQLRVRAAVFELLAIVRDAAADKQRVRGVGRKSLPLPEPMDAWQGYHRRLESFLDRPLGLNELAREAGLGIDQFTRRFRRRFGITPSDCRTRAKVREAVRQLRAGERSVKAVAYGLGFSDPDAFARLLKRRIGVAPSHLLPGNTRGDARPDSASRSMRPAPKAKFLPANAHILPFGVDSAARWDRLTESISRRPPPCDAEDYLFRRKS